MLKISKHNLALSLFFITLSNSLFGEKLLELQYGKNKNFPWELTSQFLTNLKDIFNSHTFIETGTYMGYTTKHAALIFPQVETVELSKEIYEQAKNALSNEKNVTCYRGDSATLLKHMINASKGNILFWLDGHYSGGNTAFGDRTTPIIQELETIKASTIKNSVILIDDICLFDEAASKVERNDVSGYPTINEICLLLTDINPHYNIVLLGNILLAYEENDSIKVSEVVKANTLLRTNPSAPSDELIQAERSISKAEGTELETIKELYKHFCVNEQRHLYETHGIGSHYALYYSLTLLNNNQKHQALQILSGPARLGLDNNYLEGLIYRIRNNLI